jgi:hypothetical protein
MVVNNSNISEAIPEMEDQSPRRRPPSIRRKKRRRRQLVTEPVLTFRCPVKECQGKIQLVCPFCHEGTLEGDEKFLLLICKNCLNSMHYYPCPHCTFPIKPSYIKEKQYRLRHLKERADGSKFIAVAVTVLSLMFLIWSLIQLKA